VRDLVSRFDLRKGQLRICPSSFGLGLRDLASISIEERETNADSERWQKSRLIRIFEFKSK